MCAASDPLPNKIIFTATDKLITTRRIHFRQWWHFAPGISTSLFEKADLDVPSAEGIKTTWQTTWFAEGFGRRTPRSSLCISGSLKIGEHQLRATFPLSLPSLCPDCG